MALSHTNHSQLRLHDASHLGPLSCHLNTALRQALVITDPKWHDCVPIEPINLAVGFWDKQTEADSTSALYDATANHRVRALHTNRTPVAICCEEIQTYMTDRDASAVELSWKEREIDKDSAVELTLVNAGQKHIRLRFVQGENCSIFVEHTPFVKITNGNARIEHKDVSAEAAKNVTQALTHLFLFLVPLATALGKSDQPVACQTGSWSDWSFSESQLTDVLGKKSFAEQVTILETFLSA